MTRRSQILLAVALLFLAVNLAGGVYAAAAREPLHAGLHAVLTLLAAYLVRRLVRGRAARRTRPQHEAETSTVAPGLTDRLAQLEQSVDAVALEVERVGEGQRYMTRLFTEPPPPQASPAPATGQATGRTPA